MTTISQDTTSRATDTEERISIELFLFESATLAQHHEGGHFVHTSLTVGQVRGTAPWPKAFILIHQRNGERITLHSHAGRRAYFESIANSGVAVRTSGNPYDEVIAVKR